VVNVLPCFTWSYLYGDPSLPALPYQGECK
jgi:hypothetical protein